MFVDAGARGAADGSSWSNAFTSLQAALYAVAPGHMIWVRAGTYTPAPPVSGGGSRSASFALRSGVALYGGFRGTEQALSQRDPLHNPTILSGDLAGDDAPGFLNTHENSFHVVVAIGVDESALIDGFVIRGGRADGPSFGASPDSQEQGSGINIYDASPRIVGCTIEGNWSLNHGAINDHGLTTRIERCTFRGNYSAAFGAGLYIHNHVATTARDCIFEDNETPGEGAGVYSRSVHAAHIEGGTFRGNKARFGAGLYNADASNNLIRGCTFASNSASLGGGGVYCDMASPTIEACTFTANRAGIGVIGGDGGGGGSGGGGVWSTGGAPIVRACTFTGNSASFGGGVYCIHQSSATVEDCTFTDNAANEAGGLYTLQSDVIARGCTFRHNSAQGGVFSVGGGMSHYFSNPTVEDCAFVGNLAELGGGGVYVEGESPVIRTSSFLGNSAVGVTEGWGGGLLVGYFANARIESCAFAGNRARQGGGVFDIIFANPTVSNCTFTENSATGGGSAIYNFNQSTARFYNCIAWGDSQDEIEGPAMEVSYSLIQGGYLGAGNRDADPRLVALPEPGPDGVFGTSDDVWGDLRLLPGSPCIDAGDNGAITQDAALDLAGRPRFLDDPLTLDSGLGAPPMIDMGAFEY